VYDLFVLPYRELPIVDTPLESEEFRKAIIKEWSENELYKYSFGFLFSRREPKELDDYLVPIADVIGGLLVTTREIILTLHHSLREVKETYNEGHLRVHLSGYYEGLGILPRWGTPRYHELLKEGKTPRVLYGPHKTGNLRPNQKREVLLDEDKEIIFGPLIP
jgi:hypothetical protein